MLFRSLGSNQGGVMAIPMRMVFGWYPGWPPPCHRDRLLFLQFAWLLQKVCICVVKGQNSKHCHQSHFIQIVSCCLSWKRTFSPFVFVLSVVIEKTEFKRVCVLTVSVFCCVCVYKSCLSCWPPEEPVPLRVTFQLNA